LLRTGPGGLLADAGSWRYYYSARNYEGCC